MVVFVLYEYLEYVPNIELFSQQIRLNNFIKLQKKIPFLSQAIYQLIYQE